MATNETELESRFEQRGLKESTQILYESIIARVEDKDPIKWLKKNMGPEAPIGSVLPARAAIKHFMIAEMGYTPDEVDALLPKAEGREAQVRGHLSMDQLALYHNAVMDIKRDPAHTMLHLLPQTGLKISELCELETDCVEETVIRLSEKRVIPLSASAQRVLNIYEKDRTLTPLYFGVIGPAAIRKYTRKIADTYPELEGLSPEVLRQTYIQMALSAGMDIEALRDVLGHKSTQTTRRYLET